MTSAAAPEWVVRELDPSDEPSARRFWEIAWAAHGERPVNVYEPWRTTWRGFATPRSDVRRHLLAVSPAGETAASAVVGVSELHLPLEDNLHLGYADVYVAAPHRRQGAGTALVAAIERIAAGAGRTSTLLEAWVRTGAATSPGLAFAASLGYEIALDEKLKVLDLTSSRDRWSGGKEEVRAATAGYRLVTYDGDVPSALVPGYAALREVFLADTPTGDTGLEAERWSPERVVARDARLRASGRRQLGVLALAPSGEVVGLTDLTVSDARTDLALQGITLVRGDHRGHRLGLAMKRANLRALLQAHPECRHVVTDNADVNAPMNDINAALGFVEVERLLELRKSLVPAHRARPVS